MKQTLDMRPVLTRLRAKSPPRLALVLLCLLGLLFQSHVAQNHFHHCAESPSAEPCSLPADGEPGQRDARDNPSSCALCQIAAHGGVAPLPASALAVAAPQVTLPTPADQTPHSAVAALSHSWQSRAPPAV